MLIRLEQKEKMEEAKNTRIFVKISPNGHTTCTNVYLFLYFTSHICNKIVFFDMGYIFCYQVVEKCDIIVSDVPLAIF